jgi:hypothetical protein
MSAPITTTATSLPGQLLEVAAALQNAEKASTLTEQPDNISITPDTDNGTISISVSLPVELSAGVNKVSYTATDYLV